MERRELLGGLLGFFLGRGDKEIEQPKVTQDIPTKHVSSNVLLSTSSMFESGDVVAFYDQHGICRGLYGVGDPFPTSGR